MKGRVLKYLDPGPCLDLVFVCTGVLPTCDYLQTVIILSIAHISCLQIIYDLLIIVSGIEIFIGYSCLGFPG